MRILAKRLSLSFFVLINKDFVLPYYTLIRKCNCDLTTLSNAKNGSTFISFIIAATRFPERNMKSLHNLSSIIKYLSNAIDKSYISTENQIFDIKGLCKDLNTVNKSNLKEFDIDWRMNAIGLNACLYRYTMSPLSDNVQIVNLHDPNSVKLINEKYFYRVPLDLMSL